MYTVSNIGIFILYETSFGNNNKSPQSDIILSLSINISTLFSFKQNIYFNKLYRLKLLIGGVISNGSDVLFIIFRIVNFFMYKFLFKCCINVFFLSSFCKLFVIRLFLYLYINLSNSLYKFNLLNDS